MKNIIGIGCLKTPNISIYANISHGAILVRTKVTWKKNQHL